MTKALKKAFEAASRLPDREQDELATAILEELAADERWEAAFPRSQQALERLAKEALEEQRTTRTIRASTSSRSTRRSPSMRPASGSDTERWPSSTARP